MTCNAASRWLCGPRPRALNKKLGEAHADRPHRPHRHELPRRRGNRVLVRARTDAPGSLDLCFITEGLLEPVVERLRSAGIKITVGPAPRTGALGPMASIYCEDPDGNLVEVATYAKT
jgi:catechol 2,3-dioxygenase-like lactoylglutathione lyase family enzyme